MIAKVAGKGFGEFLELYQISGPTSHSEKRLAEGELVGRDIPAEQDDGPPAVFKGGFDGDESAHTISVGATAGRCNPRPQIFACATGRSIHAGF